MKRLKLWLWMLIPLGMASCHGLVTAPWLLKHHSSAAFEMMVGIWIAILFVAALLWPPKPKKEESDV